MNRPKVRLAVLTISTALAATGFAYAQESSATPQERPSRSAPTGMPDYPGVRVHVPGTWLPPVPNEPFSAKVDILTHEVLPDGTERVRSTTVHIARSSSGRIYNERRSLVPPSFKGEPRLLAAHVYDPGTRLSIVMDPATRLARETILSQPARVIEGQSPIKINKHPGPGRTEEDLGTQMFQGISLQGIRKTRTVAADATGTGKTIVISDEYWFSPELTTYFIIKHNDPRTGEQLVTLSDVQRTEPDATVFAVPSSYKVVDETPPPPLPEYQ